ncbi:hypothetical protein CBR_g32388 [Chara braunii]|uniref:START domain-containing protein n=1 Tax=Chara braunii TaxID=69332 RepID=A0A388JYA9_CHABU|nr:hypothetical protein CBR_g32388 [Chara braunii]|eukprot:GBG62799.1 hypothetical protein CBR_g32388 [Chara braunii]
MAVLAERAWMGWDLYDTWQLVFLRKGNRDRTEDGANPWLRWWSSFVMVAVTSGIGILTLTWPWCQHWRWRWLSTFHPQRWHLVVLPVSSAIASSFSSFQTRIASGLGGFGFSCARLPRVLRTLLSRASYVCSHNLSPTGGDGRAEREVEEGESEASNREAGESSLPSFGDDGLDNLVTERDLLRYIPKLEGADDSQEPRWEKIIDKSEGSVSYLCYQRDPKDGGPTQYYSTTVFEDCTPALLRDFYMDSRFRLEWDDMLVSFKRLGLCEEMGAEIGHFVKKFPLFCSPRDYVIMWRLWNAPNEVFYYISKSCDHAAAPKQRKPVRVINYESAWRIKGVHSRTGCSPASEIVVLHREDMGLQRSMAKMGARKGTWTYVKRMDAALRLYAQREQLSMTAERSAVTLAHAVPQRLLEALSGQSSEHSPRVVSQTLVLGSADNSAASAQDPSASATNSNLLSRLPRLPSLRLRRRPTTMNRQQSAARPESSTQERQKRRKRVVLLLAAAGVVLANGAVPGLGTKIAATCLLQSAHLKLTRKWRGAPMPHDVLANAEDPL